MIYPYLVRSITEANSLRRLNHRILRAAVSVLDIAVSPATLGSIDNARDEVDRSTHRRRPAAALDQVNAYPETRERYVALPKEVEGDTGPRETQ